MKVPTKITLLGDKKYAQYFIGAAQSQLRILENQMSFQNLKQGIRRIRFNSRTIIEARICFNLREVKIYCLSAIRGIKKEYEKLPKLYVYVTISDYVTIWDLLTGEVAEDVCNNEGHINDESGNPLITFPCHKDELVTWLKGIKDRPTRQVLKDEPEDNRDFLEDNGKDIGNENRVELANKWDPSYNLYYGMLDPATFTHTVRDETINTRGPYYCYTYNCELIPMNYTLGTIIEKNVPREDMLKNCTLEECSDSFSCSKDLVHVKAHLMATYYIPYRRCRYVDYFNNFEVQVEHIQKYFRRTKHLYLSSYPSPAYQRYEGYGLPLKWTAYSDKETSAYNEAIDIEWDNTHFGSGHYLSTRDWLFKKDFRHGNVVSINTKLGSLMIDYIPYREWIEGTERIYERMRSVTDDAFLSTYLRDGVCNSISEWELRLLLWPEEAMEYAEYAEKDWTWCRNEARSAVVTRDSESNRNGISWCGSPTPRDEIDGEGKVVVKAKTKGWYRVILNFFMGGFHTDGHEARQNWDDTHFYCPNVEGCEELMEQCGDAECTATSWSNKLVERFSSVQATIEIEKPENYPKKRSLKYKRPDGYAEHKEDFTQLCAFPGRIQGYPENEEEDICYPFDGTYDIYTLGEAVEELINGHYKDGSDDQLLVYLYERPNMIKKEVRK